MEDGRVGWVFRGGDYGGNYLGLERLGNLVDVVRGFFDRLEV